MERFNLPSRPPELLPTVNPSLRYTGTSGLEPDSGFAELARFCAARALALATYFILLKRYLAWWYTRHDVLALSETPEWALVGLGGSDFLAAAAVFAIALAGIAFSHELNVEKFQAHVIMGETFAPIRLDSATEGTYRGAAETFEDKLLLRHLRLAFENGPRRLPDDR